MPVCRLNDIDIHYQDAGHGPAILLTHGFASTGNMWDLQRAALEPSWRVVTWDMRGHGETDSPDDPALYSASLTVADMVALLDRLDIVQAVVGGLSLGGYMSLDFYRRHPERVRALVICDSGPGYRKPEARARWNDNALRRAASIEEKGLDALSRGSEETRQAIRRHRSTQGLAHAARGLLTQADPSVIDSLPGIAVPTLIVVGGRDEPFLISSRYMADKIPGAGLEVIDEAGHASNLDQPARFNDVLISFLATLD